MHIYINGELCSSDERNIQIAEGYSFGYGLFETFKVEDGNIVFWTEHMERLKRGLSRIGLSSDLDSADLMAKSLELLELNNHKNGALKLTVSKNKSGRDIVITTRTADYPDSLYEKGFSLDISSSRRNPDSIMPYVKSLNYMENIIERNKSLESGFDDCLFLNTNGHIAETSISNIFFVSEETVYTPKIETGILDGVTRAKVIEAASSLGHSVLEGEYRIEELLDAREIFLTNSLMGVMPVGKLKNWSLDLDKNSVTRKIKKRYGEMVYEDRNT